MSVDDLLARAQKGREMELVLARMFDTAGWVMEACSEFRATAYPKDGGQLITLVASDWDTLRDVVYMFLIGRDSEFAATWGAE